MKLTTVRKRGSASPSLGSLIPRLRRMSAMRSGMGAVYVRIGFVQVYDESDDVLLTVFVRDEAVNILCPFLNILASG